MLYTPLVAYWLRRDGFQSADVEDLTQEVFTAVGEKLNRFRREDGPGSFRRWLRTVARNKAIDRLREACRSPVVTGGSEALRRLACAVERNGEFDDRELGVAVRASELTIERRILYERALRLLQLDFQESTWMAFWRVVVQERDAEETANELGISINAVYLAKSRVLRRLRREFVSLIE